MTDNKELTLRMWLEQQRLIAEALLGGINGNTTRKAPSVLHGAVLQTRNCGSG